MSQSLDNVAQQYAKLTGQEAEPEAKPKPKAKKKAAPKQEPATDEE